MKKSKLIIIPLITASFLFSCNVANINFQHSTDEPEEKIEYFVKFECYGGSHVHMQRVTAGNTASKPIDPTRGNDTFEGWYIDESFTTEYNFDDEVNSDLVLYAKWDVKPKKYNFAFIGTNCKVNAKYEFNTNIPINTKIAFAIIPDSGLSLPTSESVEITGEGAASATYDEKTGVILIDNIVGDITVTASAETDEVHTLTFTGTNCTINGSSSFVSEEIKESTKNVQFTIVPDENCALPTDIYVAEGNKDCISYENGTITISRMVSDFKIAAEAHSIEDVVKISFNGAHCQAILYDGGSHGYQIIFDRRKAESNEDFVIHLDPDDGYELPDSIEGNIIFDGAEANEDDYVYNKAAKTITINKVANTLISLIAHQQTPTTLRMLTFKAGNGYYGVNVKEFNIKVEKGTNLSYFLHSCRIIPTLKNNVFGYYSVFASPESIVSLDYNYKVDRDLVLEAQYFPVEEPYDDLDEIEVSSGGDPDKKRWEVIQKVAITNTDPHTCFKIGATKKILVNDIQQQIRILGFNHDELTSSTNENQQFAGITFEFVNLLSNSKGAPIKHKWDENNNYHYHACDLAKYLHNTVINMLEDCCKNKIVEVYKQVGEVKEHGDFKHYEVVKFSCHLFLIALKELVTPEVFKEIKHKVDGEGTRYEYYEIHHEYKRGDWLKCDANGNKSDYFLRSVDTSYGWPNHLVKNITITVPTKHEPAYPSYCSACDPDSFAPCFCV